MAPTPDWKRYLDAGMQFTEMRRSQARRIAADLVETGQLARDQVAGAVDEIVAMSRRRTEELRALVQAEVQRQLGSLGLATKADLERLERKLSAAAKPRRPAAPKAAKAAKAPKVAKAAKAGKAAGGSKAARPAAAERGAAGAAAKAPREKAASPRTS